ncbi:AGAP001351-PA [Anopheles gambiae str. PEST]|nr:AGAP001351-PA [Anopheles gambiae str. PEST]
MESVRKSACSSSRLIPLMCLTVAVIIAPAWAENHCSEHRYEHSLNTHHLQFTKEIPDREYGVLKQFKSLHCCGKGYRSIEW